MLRSAVISICLVCSTTSVVQARHHHKSQHHHHSQHRSQYDYNYHHIKHHRTVHHYRRHFHLVRYRHKSIAGVAHTHGNGLVTVNTSAGIPITVASSFVPKITAFIRDLVATGYRPRHIHCFSATGHVRHSLHHSGNACDIDQRGWGLTAKPMRHVASLAAKHGLRDGCSFRDCGHVDAGKPLTYAHHHRRHSRYTNYASYRDR